MKIRFLLLVFLSGCGALKSPKFSNDAYITSFRDKCLLVIDAEWPEMAHGPITLIISGTQKVKGLFTVPKVSGVIEAKDVLVEYKYEGASTSEIEVHLGQIQFLNESVIIDLKQDFREGEGIRGLSFNGTYELAGQGNCI